MFRSRRKSRNRESSVPEEEPLSITRLNGATKYVRRIIFLAEYNLVLAASYDNAVRVYHLDTTGEPCAVFKGHTDEVNDVVQLENDVVASVGNDSRLLTWRAKTVELVGKWKQNAPLISATKLGDSKIVVGGFDGYLTVLTHQQASEFQFHRRLLNSHSDWVRYITVYDDLFVSCSDDHTAKVWDTNSLTLRATVAHNNYVRSAAVSDRYIVTACGGPKICVLRNDPDYNLLFDLPLSETRTGISRVVFLSEDIVAVPAGYFLYFISIPTKSVLSRVQTEKKVNSFAVLNDGRIVVACNDGYCAIITPPKSAQGAVDDCVASLYPSSAIAAARVPPLRAAWQAVQDQQLSLAEACTIIITSENCAASLEEWCVAHQLLMEAVKCGVIPASRDRCNSIAHWHRVLYQHCAKLAMGEKCIDFVTARFKEAENAGVIAKGQIESLINTIGIRRDMDADNRFLVHATYQLFLGQAEMDVRLREVLRYQRVQQVTALVNAVIGCIPVGGAIAVNIIGGGASILNDMQVCGLVESVLGIGKDVSGGFGSDYLLDRFLQRTNAVMSVGGWRKVPAEQRKVVEEAASSLGLSIDELREKLLLVAAMQSPGGDGTPSEHVLVEDVTDDVKIEPITTVEHVFEDVALLSMEEATAGGAGPSGQEASSTATANGDECELRTWEEKGVSKNMVGPLKRADLAACFAAFLLGYELGNSQSYSKLKETMEEAFDQNRIQGVLFAEADAEEKEELVDVLMAALVMVTDEGAMKPTKMLVKRFVRLASK